MAYACICHSVNDEKLNRYFKDATNQDPDLVNQPPAKLVQSVVKDSKICKQCKKCAQQIRRDAEAYLADQTSPPETQPETQGLIARCG